MPLAFGTLRVSLGSTAGSQHRRRAMDGIIYLVGLIVIIMAILSFFGLR